MAEKDKGGVEERQEEPIKKKDRGRSVWGSAHNKSTSVSHHQSTVLQSMLSEYRDYSIKNISHKGPELLREMHKEQKAFMTGFYHLYATD